MIDFQYLSARSLSEALSLLRETKHSRLLAGGTDLIVQMKDRRANPSACIDVKKIQELNRLEWDGNSLHIGAAVPLAKIIAFNEVKNRFNILYQAMSLIGSVQVRNRGTAGGNICNAAPSADSPPALLCLGARAVIAGNNSQRILPMEKFFRGPGKTVMTADELLVEIEVPTPPPHSAGCYMRHTPREEMDIAVAGVGSFLVLDETGRCTQARIAMGAMAPTPIRAIEAEAGLTGKVLNHDLLEKAAEQASLEARPISDLRASMEYRREIVKVLARRTLTNAWQAASAGGVKSK